MLRVFLSSTYVDLRGVRRAITSLLRHSGYTVVRMEDCSIRLAHPELWSSVQVATSDVLVLLLGKRYGSRPYGGLTLLDQLASIVHTELLVAQKEHKEILIYEVDESFLEERYFNEEGYARHLDTGETIYDSYLRDAMLIGHRDKISQIRSYSDFDRIRRDID